MDFLRVAVVSSLAFCTVSTGGCAALADRTFWWPQGPGGSARREAPVEAEPQRTAQAPVTARQLQVPSELVAQTPPARAGAPAVKNDESVAIAGGYTQASRYGDLVFISGQIALDLKTSTFNDQAGIEQQTRTVMENIRMILESQRLTMANVVSVTVYLKNMNDYRGMNSVYESFFKTNLPARSVVEVSRLPRNAMVEVSVVAGR